MFNTVHLSLQLTPSVASDPAVCDQAISLLKGLNSQFRKLVEDSGVMKAEHPLEVLYLFPSGALDEQRASRYRLFLNWDRAANVPWGYVVEQMLHLRDRDVDMVVMRVAPCVGPPSSASDQRIANPPIRDDILDSRVLHLAEMICECVAVKPTLGIVG